MDENGEYTIRGEAIGQSLLITSFYDSDKKLWAKEAVIDTDDNSGIKFFNDVTKSDISLTNYMWNARHGQKYDFKVKNGTDHFMNQGG